MYRTHLLELEAWKTSMGRKPLILRGARQVGKSYLVEMFGKKHFQNTVVINFEFERRHIKSFETLDPIKILNSLSLSTGQKIRANETLLFLDEIQECPNAILALRYFKEKMPEQHVIAAGSLLEFTLNKAEFRLPVGRVQSLYLKPCTFNEYLIASQREDLVAYLETVTLSSGIDAAIHETLLDKVREYMVLGGMPEVIDHYLQHRDFRQAQIIQASLLEYYQKDFGKYNSVKTEYLQSLFDKIPGLVAQRFKYVDVDPDVQARELKPALQALIDAGLIYRVYHSAGRELPFSTTQQEKKFKLLFVDVGLVNFSCGLEAKILLDKEIMLLNRGALAEQFVGQELLAYQEVFAKSQIYYWEREKRGSSAEVDYLISVDHRIFPLEVKAGRTGRLKSLQIFLNENVSQMGVRISQREFALDGRVLSVPLYLISQLKRIIATEL